MPLAAHVYDIALLNFENNVTQFRVDYDEIRFADRVQIIVFIRSVGPVFISINRIHPGVLCMQNKT